MEFKINFIFVVMLIFTILVTVYFIIEVVKGVLGNRIHNKYHNDKLYCHDCKLAYTSDEYIATHYKYCPECGKELQYFEDYKE